MDHTDEIRNRIFTRVKPPLVRLSQITLKPGFDGSLPEIRTLITDVRDTLREIISTHHLSDVIPPPLADYIFLPITPLLKKKNLPPETTELCIQILTCLVEACWGVQGDSRSPIVSQLWSLSLRLTGGSSADVSVRSTNRKVLMAGLKLNEAVLKSIAQGTLAIERLPELAFNITILLESLVSKPEDEDIQLAALENLYIIAQKLLSSSNEMLAAVMPGIVSKVCRAINGQYTGNGSKSSAVSEDTGGFTNELLNFHPKTSPQVIVESFRILETLLSIAFADDGIEKPEPNSLQDIQQSLQMVKISDENSPTETENRENMSIEPSKRSQLLMGTKDESWIKANKEQVRIALGTIIQFRSHAKADIQLAVLNMCHTLCLTCLNGLDSSMPMLIDSIVFIASGESRNKNTARKYLEELVSGSADFTDKLLERLFEWCKSVTSATVPSLNDEKLNTLLRSIACGFNAISRYLQVQDRDSMLRSELGNELMTLAQQIFSSLVVSIPIEFPRSTAQISENIKEDGTSISTRLLTQKDGVISNTTSSHGNYFDFGALGLTRYPDREMQNALLHLLKETSRICMSEDRLSYIVLQEEHYRNADVTAKLQYCLVNVYLARSLLDSVEDKGIEISQDLTRNDLSEWLELSDDEAVGDDKLLRSTFDGSLSLMSMDMIEETAFSFLDEFSSILRHTNEGSSYDDALYCVALEGYRIVIQLLGEAFKDELADHIYIIFDMMNRVSREVRERAASVMIQVAYSCGYDSPRALILDSADYLTDAISAKLNTLDLSPQIPQFLCLLVKLGGKEVTDLMNDIVHTMFTIMDNYYNYIQLLDWFFTFFHTLVNEMEKEVELNSHKLLESGTSQGLERNGDDKNGETSTYSNVNHLSDIASYLRALNAYIRLWSGYSTEGELNRDDDREYVKDGSSNPLEDFKNANRISEEEEKSVENDGEKSLSSSAWVSPLAKSNYFLVRRIIEYCGRCLSHRSPKLRVKLLELLTSAIPILASSDLDFYPAVNEIWPFVFSRRNDSEEGVQIAFYKCVSVLLQYGGDFMSSRGEELCEQILSLLKRFFSKPQTFKKPRSTAKRTKSILNIDGNQKQELVLPSYVEKGDLSVGILKTGSVTGNSKINKSQALVEVSSHQKAEKLKEGQQASHHNITRSHLVIKAALACLATFIERGKPSRKTLESISETLAEYYIFPTESRNNAKLFCKEIDSISHGIQKADADLFYVHFAVFDRSRRLTNICSEIDGLKFRKLPQRSTMMEGKC